MNHENRKSPIIDRGLTENNSTAGGEPASIIADKSTSRDDHLGLVAGVYIAVVQVRGDHVPPRYRRRAFWNLPSAQRAVDKAVMEGRDASVILAQLVPVGGGDLG